MGLPEYKNSGAAEWLKQGLPPLERIKELIAILAMHNNYWGYLFSIVRKKEDLMLPSIMGVAPESDGSITLYVNPDKLVKTENKDVYQVLIHEGLHLLNDHIPRFLKFALNETDNQILEKKRNNWNVAADCAVNEQANIPKKLVIAEEDFYPHFPEYHNLPSGKYTEILYQLLMQKKDNQQDQNGKGNSVQNGSSETKKGAGTGSGTKQEKSQKPSSKGNSESKEKGKDSGKGDFIGDHSGWKNETKTTSDPNALVRKVEQNIKKVVKESKRSFLENSRGTLPGYINELIEDLLQPPKVPYYSIISKLVRGTRFEKTKRSSSRINKKLSFIFYDEDESVNMLLPFPGRSKDASFNLGLLLDTSGSMTTERVHEGLSASKDIIEKDPFTKVTVIEIDTIIRKEYTIKKISDIDFKVKGRGGTVLFPALERFRELKIDAVLGFTDAACDNLNAVDKKLLPKKIIWVVPTRNSVASIDRTGFIVRADY